MEAEPRHLILVLLGLVAAYVALAGVVWLIFCGGSTAAVRRLNAVWSQRGGPHPPSPELEKTLAALVAEGRLSPEFAARLRRIGPVFHRGRWTVYPSNAYWDHRFERLQKERERSK